MAINALSQQVLKEQNIFGLLTNPVTQHNFNEKNDTFKFIQGPPKLRERF